MNKCEWLEKLIVQAEELIKKRATCSMPDFQSWQTGVERFLEKRFGKESTELEKFKDRHFGPIALISDAKIDYSKDCIRDLETTVNELKDYMEELNDENAISEKSNEILQVNNRIFIVHGHNGELKQSIARMIEKMDIEPIILSDKANKGRTIIEKFEDYSDVKAAIVLLTGDDGIRGEESSKEKLRPRQNVILEAGYFMGKLGRENVIFVAERDIELPSDLQGVIYVSTDNWEKTLCRELKQLHFCINLNKLID